MGYLDYSDAPRRAFNVAVQAVKKGGGSATAQLVAGKLAASRVAKGRKSWTADITKLDADRQLVFGWFSVVTKDGRAVVDHDEDVIAPEAIEEGAYDYVLESRRGDAMHIHKGPARLVESMTFTPEKVAAMEASIRKITGRPYSMNLPVYGWWGGFRVDDGVVWKLVKSGDLRMFSIGGTGRRTAL